MKTKIFILGLLAAVLALGFGANDALANGAITGAVIDADGEPVAGAIVSIKGQARRRGERPFRVRLETNEVINRIWVDIHETEEINEEFTDPKFLKGFAYNLTPMNLDLVVQRIKRTVKIPSTFFNKLK